MDDIAVCLNKIEHYIASNLDIDSTAPQNGEGVINMTQINMVNANSSPDQPTIILDEWFLIRLSVLWS